MKFSKIKMIGKREFVSLWGSEKGDGGQKIMWYTRTIPGQIYKIYKWQNSLL